MDIKVRGIVLKAFDYKDDDKLARLYTLEQGKITAVFRGVKKAKAKLKIPAQLFCFGEYILNTGGKGIFPVATGCTVEESFFSLASNPDKFAAAASVMEIAEKCLPDNESSPLIFVQILKTMKEFLKAHTYYADGEERGNGNEAADTERACKLILLNFMLEFFKLTGFGFRLDKCRACGEKDIRERRFEFSSGGIVCKRCASQYAAPVSPLCHGVMLAVSRCETARLNTLNLDGSGLSEALSVCRQAAERIFEM